MHESHRVDPQGVTESLLEGLTLSTWISKHVSKSILNTRVKVNTKYASMHTRIISMYIIVKGEKSKDCQKSA